MSQNQKDQPPQEPEMTKLGVSCGCHSGVRPGETEMTKTASGTSQCNTCGRLWDKK